MPFVGFSFDKIEASRNMDEVKGNINVHHTLNIVDVKKEEINLEKKQDVLKFIFEFKLDYSPNVGLINLKGSMSYVEDPKKIKDILQEWKKNKKLPQEIMQSLFNTVLARANIKALSLSQDVNLPPHLPLPKVEQKVDNKKYNEYIG